jgi:hypothetical protein
MINKRMVPLKLSLFIVKLTVVLLCCEFLESIDTTLFHPIITVKVPQFWISRRTIVVVIIPPAQPTNHH